MPIFDEKVNSLLLDLEKSSEQFWNVPREVAQLLYFWVLNGEARKILEIGTSNGYSGIWMAQALKVLSQRDSGGERGVLFTIESHGGRYEMAEKNFQAAAVDASVKQVLGHAPEVFSAAPEIMKGGFDLIFMDGTKSQHKSFLEEGLGLLKSGGMIVADNALSHGEKMQDFFLMVNQNPGLVSEIVKVGDGLLIAYKL